MYGSHKHAPLAARDVGRSTARRAALGPLALALALGATSTAQGLDPDGKVLDFGKLTAGFGGFAGPLASGDLFGFATASLGDLDGNGIQDVAVGAPGDDDGGADRGAVWILFLESGGIVGSQQKISDLAGGLSAGLANNGNFGVSLDGGDVDGDGRSELVVGTTDERLFVLFLDTDGTVASEQEIASGTGGFGGAIAPGDGFGRGVAVIGDVNADGVAEVAAGAPGDDDGGPNRGAVWVLVMNANGTVANQGKISSTVGGFGAGLANGDAFGEALAGLEDLDGNGVPELAVGAPDTDGVDFQVPGPGQPPIPIAAPNEGTVFVLFLNSNGSVASKVEIGEDKAGFSSRPFGGAAFGADLSSTGDLDGNGVGDLIIGVENYANLAGTVGGFYEVFLEADGTVARERLVSDKLAGFRGPLLTSLLIPGDRFVATAFVGDIDGDCKGDIVVGAAGDDVAGSSAGALWILELEGELQATTEVRNGSGTNALAYSVRNQPRLGRTWTSEVDVSGHPGATLSILFASDAPDTVPFAFGEILISLTGETQFVDTVIPTGTIATHDILVPLDLALVGYEAFSQGLIGGGAGPELVNAVDLKLGW